MIYTNPCRTCFFWWQEDDEDFPSCKYVGNPEYAPCEVEEDYPSDDPTLWEEEDDDYAPILVHEVSEDTL